MKLHRSFSYLCAMAVLAGIPALSNSAMAASVTFTGTGNTKWNIPSNWSSGSVPVAGDEVFLIQSGSRNITVDLNTTYGAPGLLSLLLDAEGSGSFTLNSSSTFTVSGTETIGDFGKGAFNQNKGQHTANVLVLANSATNSLGTYTMKKGSLNATDLIVGNEGQGVFTHRRGTITVADDLSIGMGTNATGAYTRSRGSLTVNGLTTIGGEGTATFTQSKGKSTLDNLVIGASASGDGTMTLQKGKLTTTTTVVGQSGDGKFTHIGGTHTVDSDLLIGSNGIGAYEMSKGKLNVGGKLFVGVTGGGQLNQSGGKITVSQGLVVNDGIYTLTDGSLTTSSLTVNSSGAFLASGTAARIRASGDVTFDSNAAISTTEAMFTVAKGSEINLTVLGEDIGRDTAGFEDNYSFDTLSLERNVTLSLTGLTNENALYVDKLDLGTSNAFKIDSIIMGNGINIYYNADAEENSYLAGISYALGNGGRLIPISSEQAGQMGFASGATFASSAFAASAMAAPSMAYGTLAESEFGSDPAPIGVVPEPTTCGLLVLGLGALFFRRRMPAGC